MVIFFQLARKTCLVDRFFLLDITLSHDQLEYLPSDELETLCTIVTAIDDDLLEDTETFCLTLNSVDPNIIIDSNSAVTCVLIDNINGKWKGKKVTITNYSTLPLVIQLLRLGSASQLMLQMRPLDQ